jgi:hypothetical protein
MMNVVYAFICDQGFINIFACLESPKKQESNTQTMNYELVLHDNDENNENSENEVFLDTGKTPDDSFPKVFFIKA